MSIFKIAIFFLLTTAAANSVSSQDRLYNFVDSNINILKSQKNEPILVIGPEQYPAMYVTVNLTGYPHSIIQEAYYYLFPKNSRTFLIKCIDVILGESDSNCCKTKLLKSNPIQIDNDSIFQWLEINDSLIN